MRQFVELTDLTSDELQFVLGWRKNKKYVINAPLSFGECVELTIALSYNLHKDWSDGRFFNYILTHEEAIMGYEHDEPIDSFFEEFRRQFKKRLAMGSFNEPVTSTEVGDSHV